MLSFFFSNLSLAVRRILVRETQLPSIRPLPTVGVEPFLQAAYSEQANQWTTSPCTHENTCRDTHTHTFNNVKINSRTSHWQASMYYSRVMHGALSKFKKMFKDAANSTCTLLKKEKSTTETPQYYSARLTLKNSFCLMRYFILTCFIFHLFYISYVVIKPTQ